MKHLPVAGKAVTLLFTAAFLVACSSSDTKEQDAQDAAAQVAAEQAAAASEIQPEQTAMEEPHCPLLLPTRAESEWASTAVQGDLLPDFRRAYHCRSSPEFP